MRKLSVPILILAVAGIMASCDRGMIYDSFQQVRDDSWSWDDQVKFDVPISDTTDPFDIVVQLRHTTSYPLSNLYMFVHIEGPAGQEMTDTINFILAKKSGEWIGKGIGHLREIGYMYRKNITFPEAGEYRFSMEQAMRLEEVPVTEVGIRITKSNP